MFKVRSTFLVDESTEDVRKYTAERDLTDAETIETERNGVQRGLRRSLREL